MARPRLPSNVLELRGAFDKNPRRRRVDAEAVGPLDEEPPKNFDAKQAAMWREVIGQFPKVSITNSDRRGLIFLVYALCMADHAMAAKDLFAFTKAESIARSWLIHFGMTPIARTKFAQKVSGKNQLNNTNTFAAV